MFEVANNHSKQKIGLPVEDFQLASIDGHEISLQMILTGKKGAVVVFWSGSCSHCVRYDSYLNDFAERHPEIGLVAVASRQTGTLAQVRAEVGKRRLGFPIVHDPARRLAKRWLVHQTPRVFLLDPNHLLLYRGAIDNHKYPHDCDHAAYLETAIHEFLAGRPITRSEIASFGCAIESIYYSFPKAL